MTKATAPTEKFKKQRENTKTPPKTSIKQRLRTDLGLPVGVTIATQLSWGNDNHPTGVVKPVYGIQTFRLATKAVIIRNAHMAHINSFKFSNSVSILTEASF